MPTQNSSSEPRWEEPPKKIETANKADSAAQYEEDPPFESPNSGWKMISLILGLIVLAIKIIRLCSL